MPKTLDIPVLFDLTTSIVLLVLAIVLAIVFDWLNKKPRELGDIRMLPYQGLKFGAMAFAVIMIVQVFTHLFAMMHA